MNRSQILILIGIIILVWLGYVYDKASELIEESPLSRTSEVVEEKHGEVKQYTKSGKLKTVINYHYGRKHGMSYLYQNDGETILLAMPYEYGLREGTSKKYYEGGQLYAETNYQKDELHGIRTVYYRSGKVKSLVQYWRGMPGVGTKEYLTDGKEKDSFDITYIKQGDVLSFKTKPSCDEIRFYIGTLIEDDFFDPMSDKLRLLPNDNDQFFLDLNVYTPSFLKYQDIICSCESTQGNPIILKKRILL